MRLALVALAASLPVASPAKAPPPAGHAANGLPICLQDMKLRPVRAPEGVRLKRLGELPSGDLTLTVLNRVGDCIEPMTVRQGYGAFGGR